MNWVLTVACFTATLAIACSTLCQKQEDCGPGRCCKAVCGLEFFGYGICTKLAKKRAHCSEPEAKLDYFGGKYILYCPCEEGLSCSPYKLKEGNTDRSKFLRSLRCQEPAPTPQPKTTLPDAVTENENNGGEETGNEGTGNEETGNEGTGNEDTGNETGNEGTGNETGNEETGNETGNEETGNEETGNETGNEETGNETGNEETGNETGNEETGNETGNEETGNEIDNEETGNEETGNEETGNETDNEEIGNETGNEETGNEIGNEETENESPEDDLPVDIEQGPGGEPPRDDDCEDWTYGC